MNVLAESTPAPSESSVMPVLDASALPGWVVAVIALAVVGSLVAMLIRFRRSSRLRE